MKYVVLIALVLVVSGCATKRYGRLQGVSSVEKSSYTCEEIKLELAKVAEFERQVEEGSEFSVGSVFGILGDFGIGNKIEKDAAVKSSRERRQELEGIAHDKSCEVA